MDDIRQETLGERHDLIIDFRELHHPTPPELVEQDGVLAEHVRGEAIPHRVQFLDVAIKFLEGEFTDLKTASPDHPSRTLLGMLTWQLTGDVHPSYRLFNASADADLWFSAKMYVAEETGTPIEPVDFIRTHSPAPPLPEGLVSRSPTRYRRFGGDPVTIHVGQRTFHKRLLIGSLDEQPDQRPDVDAVLNLGEESSKWVVPPAKTTSECDRRAEKGCLLWQPYYSQVGAGTMNPANAIRWAACMVRVV